MKMKVESMTLNQFRGVMNNAEVLMERLAQETRGQITPEQMIGHLVKYFDDNGVHTTREEVQEFMLEVMTENIAEVLSTDLLSLVLGGMR